MLRESKAEHKIVMERFYRREGITRQGYSQAMVRQKEHSKMLAYIKQEVDNYRLVKDRRAGSRSLFHNLEIKEICNIGVNKFERLMSQQGWALAPYKTRLVTTKSCSRSREYDNLTKGLTINAINQLVVGDITYVYVSNQLYFLFLLTDVYSARITGWNFGTRMRAIEAHKAFFRWMDLRGIKNLKNCVHHTDGGRQYFSNLYLNVLLDNEIQVSVADNCLENGFAEQRNGLIKNHFLPTVQDGNPRDLPKKMDEILYIYNNERKQEALGWLSPSEFEEEWTNHQNPPKMTIYDRENKTITLRRRVF